ncbi:hypothetical protein [Clostridium culturomicium]|uniref:hypothetical protein n=1 Tax=Clostridium culturomicium TaxID=1499683 RepID=UPI003857974F
MDTDLILITIGLLGVFHFMSVITLKNKLESLQKGIDKQNYVSDERYKSVIKTIVEKAQFQEKALGHLAEKITSSNNDVVQEIRRHDLTVKHRENEQFIDLQELIAACDDEYIEANRRIRNDIRSISERLESKIDKSTRDINFITKQQAGRIISTPLRVMMEQPKVEAKIGN